MLSSQLLYKLRTSRVFKEFVGYLLTGGVATIVDLVVFSILVNLGLGYIVSLCISFTFGASTNFFLSRRFVFDVYYENRLIQYGVFMTVALNILLMNLGIMKILVDYANWEPIVSRLFSACCVVIISFITQKFFAFSPYIFVEEQQFSFRNVSSNFFFSLLNINCFASLIFLFFTVKDEPNFIDKISVKGSK